MYITDNTSQLAHNSQASGLIAGFPGNRILLAVEDEPPSSRRCAGDVAVLEVDPLDLVETVREASWCSMPI
jgi:hypothetical protein